MSVARPTQASNQATHTYGCSARGAAGQKQFVYARMTDPTFKLRFGAFKRCAVELLSWIIPPRELVVLRTGIRSQKVEVCLRRTYDDMSLLAQDPTPSTPDLIMIIG